MAENVELIYGVVLSALFTALAYYWTAATTEVYLNFMLLLAIFGTIVGYLFMIFKQHYDQEHQNQFNQFRQKIEHHFQAQQKELQQLQQEILEPIFEEKQNALTAVVTQMASIVNEHDETINSTINKLLIEHGDLITNHDQRFENLEANHRESVQNHDQRVDKLITDHHECNKNHDQRFESLKANHQKNIQNHDQRIDKLVSDFYESNRYNKELIGDLKTDLDKNDKFYENEIKKFETNYEYKHEVHEKRINDYVFNHMKEHGLQSKGIYELEKYMEMHL